MAIKWTRNVFMQLEEIYTAFIKNTSLRSSNLATSWLFHFFSHTFTGCKRVLNGFQTSWKLRSQLCGLHTWGTSSHTYTHMHKDYINGRFVECTYQVKWLLTCCVSPEELVRIKKHHSDPVSAQLDSVWGCRPLPSKKCICSSRGTKVWCDKCGGLVRAGRDAIATEVPAEWCSFDASKPHTRLPPSVVRHSNILD